MSNQANKEMFRTWRVRKRFKDGGMCTVCQFEWPFGSDISADKVPISQSVKEWIGDDTLDDVYHPEGTP